MRISDWSSDVCSSDLTDYPYEDFKDIYRYAHETGLKGCTTFRFNPAAFQGVLVTEADLANTTYRFELDDGSVVEVPGHEQIESDAALHTADNLFDALKAGYYGKRSEEGREGKQWFSTGRIRWTQEL